MSEFEQPPHGDLTIQDLSANAVLPSYFDEADLLINPQLLDEPLKDMSSAAQAKALVAAAVALDVFRSGNGTGPLATQTDITQQKLKQGIDKLHDRFPENAVLPIFSLNFTPQYTLKAMIRAYNKHVPYGAELNFDEESYDTYNISNKSLNNRYQMREGGRSWYSSARHSFHTPQLSLRGLLLDRTLGIADVSKEMPPDMGNERTLRTANLADIIMSDMVLRNLGQTLAQALPSMAPDTFLQAQNLIGIYNPNPMVARVQTNDFRTKVVFSKQDSSDKQLLTVTADDENELR